MSIKWKELVSLVQLKLVSFVTVGRGDLNPISSFLLMLGLLKLFIKNGTKTLKKLIDIVKTVS